MTEKQLSNKRNKKNKSREKRPGKGRGPGIDHDATPNYYSNTPARKGEVRVNVLQSRKVVSND